MSEVNEVIYNRARQPVDVTNSYEFTRLLLERVPDPVVRSILFGSRVDKTNDEELVEGLSEEKLGGEAGTISVMRSTVNLAFVTVLSRWKQLYDNDTWGRPEHIKEFRGARFSKLFLSALGKEDITLDLQIFSLMELWVCLKKVDNIISDQFSNIFGTKQAGENIGLILQDVRDALKNATYRTLETGKYTVSYCNRLLYHLIRSFPFLYSMQISYPSDSDDRGKQTLRISYAEDLDERVDLYPNKVYDGNELFVITERQLLSMRGEKRSKPANVLQLFILAETSAFTGKLQYTYRSFDGEMETRIEVEEAPVSSEYAFDNDVYAVRRFLSFSYKNIREFALVVSDAIKNSPVKQRKIFELCRSRYPKIMPEAAKSFDAPEIYWDNVITLLLVEMGPSDFLEIILEGDDGAIFDTLLENIKWRCLGADNASALRSEYDAENARIEKKHSQNPRNYLSRLLSLRIHTVLQAMGFDKQERNEMHPFEESLTFKFDNILACVKVLDQYWQRSSDVDLNKCEEARKELLSIFRNIFLFLQIFYTALDRYAIVKKEYDTYLETEKARGDIDEYERSKKHKEFSRKMREAFANAGAEKYEEIKEQTLCEAFDGFCKMCEQYNKFNENNGFSVSEEAKRLKYLITRNYICDVQKLRYFADITLADGEQSTIFRMLEEWSFKYYHDDSFPSWLGYFSDIFLFLIYNEDYSEKGLYKKADTLVDKDCDPVYPYLVTYYRENVDRDNLKKCTYRVPVPTGRNSDTRDQGFVVTLLTDEDFPAATYFCIPLRYGSSENWWINPFLIPRGFVRRMEDIIAEKGKQKAAKAAAQKR